jgi:hypothetical protein
MAFFFKRARARSLKKPSTTSTANDNNKNNSNNSSTGPPKRLTVKDVLLNSLNIFKEDHMSKTKILDNLMKSNTALNNAGVGGGAHEHTDGLARRKSTFLSTSVLVLKQKKREYALKVMAITFIWIVTGYSYLRAIDLLVCSDLIILFSVNFSLIYMGQWIFLQHKFIPIRVNFLSILISIV